MSESTCAVLYCIPTPFNPTIVDPLDSFSVELSYLIDGVELLSPSYVSWLETREVTTAKRCGWKYVVNDYKSTCSPMTRSVPERLYDQYIAGNAAYEPNNLNVLTLIGLQGEDLNPYTRHDSGWARRMTDDNPEATFFDTGFRAKEIGQIEQWMNPDITTIDNKFGMQNLVIQLDSEVTNIFTMGLVQRNNGVKQTKTELFFQWGGCSKLCEYRLYNWNGSSWDFVSSEDVTNLVCEFKGVTKDNLNSQSLYQANNPMTWDRDLWSDANLCTFYNGNTPNLVARENLVLESVSFTGQDVTIPGVGDISDFANYFYDSLQTFLTDMGVIHPQDYWCYCTAMVQTVDDNFGSDFKKFWIDTTAFDTDDLPVLENDLQTALNDIGNMQWIDCVNGTDTRQKIAMHFPSAYFAGLNRLLFWSFTLLRKTDFPTQTFPTFWNLTEYLSQGNNDPSTNLQDFFDTQFFPNANNYVNSIISNDPGANFTMDIMHGAGFRTIDYPNIDYSIQANFIQLMESIEDAFVAMGFSNNSGSHLVFDIEKEIFSASGFTDNGIKFIIRNDVNSIVEGLQQYGPSSLYRVKNINFSYPLDNWLQNYASGTDSAVFSIYPGAVNLPSSGYNPNDCCQSGDCLDDRATIELVPTVLPDNVVEEDRGLKECCYGNMVFGYPGNITDEYKNDYRGLYYQRQNATDDGQFILIEEDGTEHDIPSNSNIIDYFFDYGELTNSNLKVCRLHWGKVLNIFGPGAYTIEVRYSIGPVSGVKDRRQYNLREFTIDAADKTARIESLQTGYLEEFAVDFMGFEFYDMIRSVGFFGASVPEYQDDRLVYNNTRKEEQVRNELNNIFTYETGLIPDCISFFIIHWHLLGNEIFMSDYNRINHRYVYKRTPVYFVDMDEPEYYGVTRDCRLSIRLRDLFRNKRKRNC